MEFGQEELDDENSFHYFNANAEHGVNYEILEKFGVNQNTWDGTISSARITGRKCAIELESNVGLGKIICTLRHGDYNSTDLEDAGCKHEAEEKITHYTVLGMPVFAIQS